jgi:hypothetical protein
MPIQVISALILLYRWLGVASLVSLGVIIALAPVNYWMFGTFTKTDDEIMKQKDKRVKSLTEILQVSSATINMCSFIIHWLTMIH